MAGYNCWFEKQPNSLKNLLVRAEISKPNTNIGKSYSCGDKRCKCCRHMQNSLLYTSKITGNGSQGDNFEPVSKFP
jgi:hypothetical protein